MKQKMEMELRRLWDSVTRSVIGWGRTDESRAFQRIGLRLRGAANGSKIRA